MAAEKEQKSYSGKNNEYTAAKYNRIKNVIAVMSGKGGVGKSFVTGLLASGLSKNGYKVGILDADITGPSIPMLFGLHGPVTSDQHGILPLQSDSGIRVISMNLLLASEDQPVIWRGPLISKAIKQLWEDVVWEELDYLLVDLPPGTSDAALTIMQSLPLKGVIMVTTPQGLAAMIVKKAIHMAQEIGVPIIGIVENMAYYHCPDTEKKHFIFGQCHGDSVAKAAQTSILTQIPLDPSVAELCDSGKIEHVVLDESKALVDTFVKLIPVSGKQKLPLKTLSPFGNKGVEFTGKQQLKYVADETEKPFVKKPFSDTARRMVENKENMGCIESPDAHGSFRGPCGDSMKIDLRVVDGKIQEARFMTDGCGATIACGSMLTKLVQLRSLDEAKQITPEELLNALGGLPEDHQHCAVLAVKTLQEALKNVC
ncbi:MAG: P-loop NTPase [Flexilinea sp.]